MMDVARAASVSRRRPWSASSTATPTSARRSATTSSRPPRPSAAPANPRRPPARLGAQRTIGVLSVSSTDFQALVDHGRHRAGDPQGQRDVGRQHARGVQESITELAAGPRRAGRRRHRGQQAIGVFTLRRRPGRRPAVLSLSGRYGISTNRLMVDADQSGGGFAATEHLLALGHRTVHHVGPARWRSAGPARGRLAADARRRGARRPRGPARGLERTVGLRRRAAPSADPDVTASGTIRERATW